ncbi:MAG: NADAR family protein [Candidatus Paceibacterota bacterium]
MKSILPLEIFAIYFSPYSAHAIEIDGLLYPTVEHAYQCARYTDRNIIEAVRNAKSPVEAWRISAQYKSNTIPEFSERKLSIMKDLMRKKVEQHSDVRQALIDSKDMLIVKHITTGPPADGFWDDGEDGKGLNHIGNMWMEIRDDLNNSGK